MKRILIALPLLALLLGLAVYLARNPATTREAASSGAPAPQSAGHSTPPSAPAPGPKPPATTSPDLLPTGALRFVVTMSGKPCPDALLTVQKGGTNEFMTIRTEADGTQLLHGLAAGEYGITVQQDDASSFGTLVLVEPGQTVVIPVDLKTGGRVTGTVTDRGGHPVPGTRVFLLDEATKGPPNSLFCLSDEKGHYALKGIPPGAFGVRYRHVEYKPLDRMGLVFRGGAEDYQIDVALEVGARISGRVVDEAGAPIPGADVIAGNPDSAGVAKSAADGSFTVTGLTDAPANISAAKAGYGKVVLRNLSGNPSDVLFRLPKAGTILGRVLIDEIPRQTQINLSRYDEDLKQIIPAESRFFALPTTATFAFENVPPGTYWIDVLASGYEAAERPQVVVGSGQITNEIRIPMRKKN